MNDVLTMIRASVSREDVKREANRAAYPGVAAIVDEFTAAFGPVRVLHAIEGGKTIGKPQPFDGTDVDQIIRLDDAMKKRGTAA